jgi:hypothetical protein
MTASFAKIRAVKAVITGVNECTTTNFHIRCPPRLVKLGVTDLQLNMFGICEILKHRSRRGHTYLVDVDKVAFTRVFWEHLTDKRKERLSKLYHVTECTVCCLLKLEVINVLGYKRVAGCVLCAVRTEVSFEMSFSKSYGILYTGRFIMYSGITNIYDSKTVGHVFTKPLQIEGTTQNFFPQKVIFHPSSHFCR